MMKLFCIFLFLINLTLGIIKVKDTENNITVGIFIDAEARFGGDFDDGTMAYLIESHPLLACNTTIDPPPIYLPNGSNIIFVSLIKRGICTFENKVRAAQNSGYQGVIIYNNNSDNVFNMPKPDNSDYDTVFIPSRMVGRTNGYKLRKFTFTLVHQQYVVIFLNNSDNNTQYYIIAFLTFVSLGFLIIGISFAAKLSRECIQRRANRLRKCHLNKIPIKKFHKGEDLFDTCPICLEDFIDGDKLRILACNHAYHVKCIDPWLLKQRRNCPMCKCRVKIAGREEESDENVSVVTPSEFDNVMVDEHTPLINPRDVGPSQSYFSYNESDVNIASEVTGSAQSCYDNSCINVNVKESCGSANKILSINDDNDINLTTTDISRNVTQRKPLLRDLVNVV